MKWPSIARIVVQLLLVAPMLMLFPFAVAISYMAMVMLFVPGPGGVSPLATFCQLFASVGLIFLFISIAGTTAALRRPPLRGLVTGGLVLGLLSAVVWLGLLAAEPDGHAPPIFNIWTLYLFGGAIVVALWNLWRAWGRESLAAESQPSPPLQRHD